MYKSFVKRLIDVIVALCVLIICMPVFLLIALLILILNRTSPLFFQERPGKNGKLFRMAKFKTMNNAKNDSGMLLSDEERVTGFGKFLRRTSMDELPQVWNVIQGEMSLVGPRPLLVEYLSLYSEEQHKRHLVKPGITGWAQVNGRKNSTWEQKFAFDVYYVKNISFILDIKIIFLTFLKIFESDGLNEEGEIVMNRFKGNKKI